MHSVGSYMVVNLYLILGKIFDVFSTSDVEVLSKLP